MVTVAVPTSHITMQGTPLKNARERMDMISAYRDVGSYRGAAAICGTTHKTVKRIIELHEAGGTPVGKRSRARNYDEVTDLVAKRVKDTSGRLGQAAAARGAGRAMRGRPGTSAAWSPTPNALLGAESADRPHGYRAGRRPNATRGRAGHRGGVRRAHRGRTRRTSIVDDHYGGPRPDKPHRAARPRTAAEKAFLGMGPVAEAFLTGAAAAGVTKLTSEINQILALHAAHGTQPLLAALERAVRFGRWRAADVRSILAALGAGAGAAPTPRPAGQALVLTLPKVPTRSLDAYRIDGGDVS